MDWSTIATSLAGEISGALPAFAAVISVALGVPLAFKVVKRVL